MDSHYTRAAWEAHPGRNPAHTYGGYSRWATIPDPKRPTMTIRICVMPPNPSRWLPHQSTREMARRRRRMAA